jgi:hypothetical protein
MHMDTRDGVHCTRIVGYVNKYPTWKVAYGYGYTEIHESLAIYKSNYLDN